MGKRILKAFRYRQRGDIVVKVLLACLLLALLGILPSVLQGFTQSNLDTALQWWKSQGYVAYASPDGTLYVYDIEPNADDTYDIGTTVKRFQSIYSINVYVDGVLYAASGNISGNLYLGDRVLSDNGTQLKVDDNTFISAPGIPDYVVGVNTADDDVPGSIGYWVKSGATGQVVRSTASPADDDINYALALGSVSLTDGTFFLSANTPLLPISNSVLSGQGKATIIKFSATSTNSALILLQDVSNVSLSNFFLDCTNDTGGDSKAIFGDNADNCLVKNIWVDGQDQTRSLICFDSDSDYNTVTNCLLWDSALQHIFVGGDYNIVTENHIIGPASGGEGITVEVGGYNTLQGNIIIHGGDSIVVGNGATYTLVANNIILNSTVNAICLYVPASYTTVQGNIVYGVGTATTGQNGIYISGTNDHIIIDGNQLIQVAGQGSSDSNGIFARSLGGLIADIAVTNNIVENWKQFGIRVGNDAPTTYVLRAVVQGNISNKNGYDGIRAETNNAVVEGNVSSNNTSAGIRAEYVIDTLILGNRCVSNNDFGMFIRVHAGAPTRVPVVRDNVLTGNTVGLFIDGTPDPSTAGYIQNNVGYVTENSGTATMLINTGAIVVNHGLATTPTRVIVTMTSNPGLAVSTWVNTLTTTQFTINTSSNVTAATTFNWRAWTGEGN